MSAMVDSSVASPFDGFEESIMRRPMYTDHHHSELVFQRFLLLREKNLLTDAVISSSDDKRFNVHSNIMAGKSDYFFNKLLNAGEHDTSCQLNIDSDAVEVIITFCYSGTAELTIDNVEGVFDGARELQIDSLMSLCCEMLEEMLDITNCIRFLELANKNNLHDLKVNALAVISEELPHINRLPEFYLLNGSQMFALIEALSSSKSGIFDDLLKSLSTVETVFSAMQFNGGADAQTAIRAAYITGYFQGSIGNTSPIDVSNITRSESTAIDHKIQFHLSARSECAAEYTKDLEPETTETPEELIHVLALVKRKTIQISTFCEIEQRWERTSKKIDLTHTIESYRDAFMIPVNHKIVIFFMRNGVLSQAQHLLLDAPSVEHIALPNDAECAGLALFCPLNDKIYCFPRTDQQYFYRFDSQSKNWSTGQIDDVLDAKYIVGLKDELYFVGCGFNRTIVRSYHIEQKLWRPKGNLRVEHKETCFRAAQLNGSVYVVMSCFDSAKIYNGTEFVVQRYDENVEDWIIIEKIYYSHFVDYFHMDVAGNCLYIFYGDGEVKIYNEELNEWQKGPSIDYNVLDVPLCMVAVKSNDKSVHK